MNDLIKLFENKVLVKEADLSALIAEVKSLREEVSKLQEPDTSGSDILTTKDVMKDLDRSRKTIDRLMKDPINSLPMVHLSPRKLGITREKYEAWKRSIGL